MRAAIRRPSGARRTRPAAATVASDRPLDDPIDGAGREPRARGPSGGVSQASGATASAISGRGTGGRSGSLASGSPRKTRCRSVTPGATTWPAPITHWATVAPASTRLPLPTTVGPMIVTPSPTSAPSCSTTGPTRFADGWTRTPGAACSEEPRPSRVGVRRARSSTMRSFRARRPCSVPRFTAPPSRGRSRLGTPSEARTRRRRGREASGSSNETRRQATGTSEHATPPAKGHVTVS